MSDGRTASATAATRVGSGAGRLVRAWRTMPHERRLAAYAAIGLFLSLFLPWYQRQFFVVLAGKIQPASDSQTAWGAFSFVEAAILLVAAGVLVLLFQRAEGKAFHLPGGDGGVITAAGVWSAILIIWRIFDKQGGAAQGQNATTYGIEWGIFIALAVAIGLTYAGSRIRAAHRPEPPLPGEDDPVPAPRAPMSPAPADMPVLEARVVSSGSAPPPPVPAQPATPGPVPARSAPPAPVPAEPPGPDPVEFVPSEPAEFLPRRGTGRPSQPRPGGERERGWLTAAPRHLDETADAAPAQDTDATLPVAPDDTAATLPSRRGRRPPRDDQLTIPLEHDD
jgi:hypothetical protein